MCVKESYKGMDQGPESLWALSISTNHLAFVINPKEVKINKIKKYASMITNFI